MKKERENFFWRIGGRFLTKALVAGAGILLASALLQAPDAVKGNTDGFYFVTVARADDLTQTTGSLSSTVNWTFDPSTGTLTISGSGAIPNYGYGEEASPFMQKANIQKLVIRSGITEVGEKSFQYCNNLKTVTFPSTLTRIGSSAFFSAGLENSITIPGSVKTIETHAFTGNDNLAELKLQDGVETIAITNFYGTSIRNIYLPKSVTSFHRASYISDVPADRIDVDPANPVYKSVDGVLYDKSGTELLRFPGNRTGSFWVPDGVTTIQNNSFYGSKLSRVVLPDSVTLIEDNAFRWMRNLTDITIPKNAKIRYDNASDIFSDCYLLEAVKVAPQNPYYSSVDGVVYSKDKTKLLYYPCNKKGKSYAVLNGVTTIDSWSFSNVPDLQTIIFPNSLTTIEYSAIFDCENLTHLVFPSKIDTLKGQILCGCNKLKHIYFLQPKSLSLNIDLNNSSQSGMVLHTYAGVPVNGGTGKEYVDSKAEFSLYSPIDDGDAVSVRIDRTVTLKPLDYVSASSMSGLTYVVRNSSVLKVSSSGVITPLERGNTEVYASGNGKTIRFVVKVTGFTDVKKGDYYFDSVYWAVDRGITGGVKDSNGNFTRFDPQGTCSRAQMVTFLYRHCRRITG